MQELKVFQRLQIRCDTSWRKWRYTGSREVSIMGRKITDKPLQYMRQYTRFENLSNDKNAYD